MLQIGPIPNSQGAKGVEIKGTAYELVCLAMACLSEALIKSALAEKRALPMPVDFRSQTGEQQRLHILCTDVPAKLHLTGIAKVEMGMQNLARLMALPSSRGDSKAETMNPN